MEKEIENSVKLGSVVSGVNLDSYGLLLGTN